MMFFFFCGAHGCLRVSKLHSRTFSGDPERSMIFFFFFSRCHTGSLRLGGAVTTPSDHPPPPPHPPTTPTLQQPDTGDERSRQACKRGVPSRPVCLSVCRAELQTVNAERCRPPRGKIRQPAPPNPAVCRHGSNKSRLL